jgi:arylsulfatase A
MNASHTNIVLILADDLGYGDLGIYGNELVQTPYLDRLADEGVRLVQHYTCSPLCAPARAGLLTGRYNHRTGALSVESNRGLDRIDLREMTIADYFGSAGYTTGMVGKWHNGVFDMCHHPNNRGFDEFAGFLNGGMGYFDWILDYNGEARRSDSRYLTDVFTQESVNFIERHRNEPFFLFVSYNAPHAPLEAPEEEIETFADTDELNPAVKTLYAMIRRMDAGIGSILETLDRHGLTNNTIVLFTSDNGPWLGNQEMNGQTYSMSRYNGPFRGMKQDVLEGGIRVPAIICWPDGLPQGLEVNEMIHFTDWLPTLLTATGVNKRHELALDGACALPILRGEKGNICKRFWQFNRYEPVRNCNGAMRDGDWKLYWPRIPEAMAKLGIDNVWYQRMFREPHFTMDIDRSSVKREVPTTGKPELYNIHQDHHESMELSEKYPDRLEKMILEYENWFEEVNLERRSLPEAWKC